MAQNLTENTMWGFRLKSKAVSDQMILQKKNVQEENEHQSRSHI